MENHLFLAVACMLVHIPSIFIRLAPFREIVTQKQRWILIPLYLLVLLSTAIVYYLMPDEYLITCHKIMLIIVAAVLTAINIIFIPGYWREHCFSAGLASVHVSVTFFLAAYLVLHIGNVASPVKLVALSAVTTLGLFFLLFRFYCNATRRVVTPFLTIDAGTYWNKIWYIPLGVFFSCFFAGPLDTYSGSTTLLLCRGCLLVTMILTSNAITQDHFSMRHQLELAEQLNIQQEYYSDLSDRVAEARKNRHDFKHHMAAIRRYIDTDDKEGLTEYWNELQVVLSHDTSVPYTGNSALDGVLYRYSGLCRQEGIRLDFSGVLVPLVMPDTDLCVLLGNALDNAFTACLRAKNDAFITVTARNSPGTQTLLIVNSYDGIMDTQNGKILSRKRNHEPGIGLESIQAICEKNNTVTDIRYDEKTFQLLLVIPTKA